MPKSDIEIARAAVMQPIDEIAAKLNIDREHISPFGHHKAKVSLEFLKTLEDRPDAKLVLVTAITPTPAPTMALTASAVSNSRRRGGSTRTRRKCCSTRRPKNERVLKRTRSRWVVDSMVESMDGTVARRIPCAGPPR